MRTPSSFLPKRVRNTISIMAAALAMAVPAFVQPSAQAAPATKPLSQPAKGAPVKPAAAQPATAQPATPKLPATPKAAPAASTKALVDINHATVKQLKTIPGIGDAYAAKIVAGRPYANKSQLVSKQILAQSLYETIQGMIIAKQ